MNRVAVRAGRTGLVGARRRAQRPPLLLVAPAAVAAAVAALPLAYLAVRAGGNGPGFVLDVLTRGRTAALVWRSLLLTVLVTAACLVVGVGAAWLVGRCVLTGGTGPAGRFGRRAIPVVLALPLAVPSYVAAFAWRSAWPSFDGLAAAVVVLTAVSYPYVYLPVLAALRGADPGLEEVSRSLGRGPWRTFGTVTSRQIAPAAGGGALLVALYTLSDFGAVSILRYDVFTRVIYTSYRSSFDRTQAAVLAALLVLITVLIVAAEARTRARADLAGAGPGARREPLPVRLGRWQLAAVLALTAVITVALGVPLAALAWWLVSGGSGAIDLTGLATAGLATVWVSALGAAVTVLLALPVGVLAARYRRWRGSRLLEQACYAGHALPGIVVALALVFLGVTLARPLYQTTGLLVLGYAVLFLPAGVAAVRGSLALSSPAVEQVAASLGQSPRQVLTRVTVPLASPGIAAGAVLVFFTCMKELPATLLLRPTGLDTLATQLWTATSVSQYGQAAPYAALLVLLACLPAALLGPARGKGDARG